MLISGLSCGRPLHQLMVSHTIYNIATAGEIFVGDGYLVGGGVRRRCLIVVVYSVNNATYRLGILLHPTCLLSLSTPVLVLKLI